MLIRKLALGVGVAVVALGAAWSTAQAFDPQPDPPAFGVVSITPDQTIRLNLLCYEHGVGRQPASRCSADVMFHDAAGNVVARESVWLRRGESTFLDFTIGARTSPAERAGIIPCIVPGPESGRIVPTVEVFDSASGQTAFLVNPVTPRLSFIESTRTR